MHAQAKLRLRELIRDLLVDLCKSDGVFRPAVVNEPVGEKVLKFIKDTFPRHSYDPISDLMWSIWRSAERLSLSGPGWNFAFIHDDAKREELLDEVVNWWATVPRPYQFTFPLPKIELSKIAKEGIELCPGVVIQRIPNPPDLVSITPGAHSSVAPTEIVALLIIEHGIVSMGNESEPAPAAAIRTCKQVVLLAQAMGIFENEYMLSAPNVAAMRSFDIGEPARTERVAVDGRLGFSLGHLRACDLPQTYGQSEQEIWDERASRLRLIGSVINGSREHTANVAVKRSAKPSEEAKHQHCERIATAAAWLFDSEGDASKARAYMQIAIGFEALYGGGEDEPVVSTLTNRLAYSLAKTAAERRELIESFGKFYKKRSKIVHAGQSSLDLDEMDLLRWSRRTLRRALCQETMLVTAEVGNG